MYYILFYKTVENYVEKRLPHRQNHFAYLNDFYKRGEIVMAGALDDPADEAVLVFKTEDKTVVEDFATNDPYVMNGLISEWRVRPWVVVFGGD